MGERLGREVLMMKFAFSPRLVYGPGTIIRLLTLSSNTVTSPAYSAMSSVHAKVSCPNIVSMKEQTVSESETKVTCGGELPPSEAYAPIRHDPVELIEGEGWGGGGRMEERGGRRRWFGAPGGGGGRSGLVF